MEPEDDPVDPPAPGGDDKAVRVKAAVERSSALAKAGPPPIPEKVAAPAAPPAGSPPAAPPAAVPAEPSGAPAKVSRLVSTVDLPEGDRAVPGPASDADRRWLEMNKGDQEAANRKALEDNNRLAALTKENEALKAAGKPPAPTAPSAEQPAPAEPPVEVTAEEITTQAKAAAAADAECKSLASEYQTAEKRLTEIVKFDANNRPVDGELVVVARRIAQIEGYLDPEKAGIKGAPVLDEIQREELTREMKEQRLERERLLSEHQRLESRAESITEKYNRRFGGLRSAIERDALAKAQAAKQDETYGAEHAAATTEWKAAADDVLKGEDQAVRDLIEEQLLLKASAIYDVGRDIPSFRAWMEPEVAKIRDVLARKAGLTAAEVAKLKERDARTPAPLGQLAVAPAPSPSSAELSPRDRRRAAERLAASRAKSIQLRTT